MTYENITRYNMTYHDITRYHITQHTTHRERCSKLLEHYKECLVKLGMRPTHLKEFAAHLSQISVLREEEKALFKSTSQVSLTAVRGTITVCVTVRSNSI